MKQLSKLKLSKRNTLIKNNINLQFLIVGSILLVMFSVAYILHPELFSVVIQGDEKDTFMDYFNSVGHAIGRAPYKIKAIYPPLCYVIYWIMGMLMGDSAMIILSENTQRQLPLKELTLPMLVFGIYFLVSFGVFLFLTYKMIKGKVHEKVWFLMLMSSSVPFMFQFERANIIFISLLGSLIFFLWKDSENKYLRELAFICLALSAALKIYPAIFGLVLLKEKRYKETIRLVIYGAICFFLPFLFMRGGYSNIPLFIKNLIYTSTIDQANRDGYKLSYSALSSFTIAKITNNVLLAEQIGSKLAIVLAAFGVCAFPWIKKSWKRILLLACLLVGVPNMSYVYTSIFLIIPLIAFLNSEEEGKMRWVYMGLFIMIFFPLPFGWNSNAGVENYYIFNRSFNSLQISAAVFFMTILLIGEGAISFCKQTAKYTKARYLMICLSVVLAMFCIGIWSQNSYEKVLLEQKEIVQQKTIEKCMITFNGQEYWGRYKGETIDSLPNGEGKFTSKDKNRIHQIEGVFKNKTVEGSIKIQYSNGQTAVVNCQNGMPYGRIVFYDTDGNIQFTDRYYGSAYLSNIKKNAVLADYDEISRINAMNPGSIFKYTGKVKVIHQFKTWVEIEIEDSEGNSYLSAYENGIIGTGSQSVTPNLKINDSVECYGTLETVSNKSILKMGIITIDIVDNQEAQYVERNGTYEDIVRYPYAYDGSACKLKGKVKNIEFDYERDTLFYTIAGGEEYIVGMECSNLFQKGYKLPLDEKDEIIQKVKKKLPKVGDSVQIEGDYAGNFILEDSKVDGYILVPYVRTIIESAEIISFQSGIIK